MAPTPPPETPDERPIREISAPRPTGPLHVRVGLATDLETFALAADPRLHIVVGDQPQPLRAALRVAPGRVQVEEASYRLQVAALKNEQQAEGIANYLRDATGEPTDAVFNAGTDLYRVRVGRFAQRQEAEALRENLTRLGIVQGWIASEGGDLENPELLVTLGATPQTVAGRWLDITAPQDVGIPYQGVRYRGKISVYLNDRGRLNVVNEVLLEDYLRGVVPKEMGPELYNKLEVLKAQAVAARTYTLRNLGEFESEGYDICSTPRCQVYGGMSVEHKRSDRAVRETEGQVVLTDGQPAETFYSATCGGHTENVEVVFPLKLGTYLRGVPCMEAGAGRVVGQAQTEARFPDAITHRLLPKAPGRPTQVLSARFEHLAFLSGLPIPRDRLRDTSRREVLRFVGSVFDLALHKRLLLPPERLTTLLNSPPEDWRQRDQRFADYLLASGLTAGAGEATLLADEAEHLLFELALYLGALRLEEARYLGVHNRLLTVRQGAERREHRLPKSLLTFRRLGDRDLQGAALELMAGDRLDFYWRSDELLALVQPVAASPVDLKRHARRLSWTRHKTRQQLTESVQARYPGFPFKGFEVMSRGVSGRIGKLRLLGAEGEQMMVEGLAVRWTMDLYDTNFYFKPRGDDPVAPGWTFSGRGWGHGVGMCQAGAYGMAARGIDYRAILEHYYTGIELGRLLPAPNRQRVAAEVGP